jgi:hypothetical protein
MALIVIRGLANLLLLGAVYLSSSVLTDYRASLGQLSLGKEGFIPTPPRKTRSRDVTMRGEESEGYQPAILIGQTGNFSLR